MIRSTKPDHTIIPTFIFIYLIGSLITYCAYKNHHKEEFPDLMWTNSDRRTDVAISLFSWISLAECELVWWGESNGDQKASW